MSELPEIEYFTEPSFLYDIGDLIRITFYKDYPNYFYLNMIPEGRTLALPKEELRGLINALETIWKDS